MPTRLENRYPLSCKPLYTFELIILELKERKKGYSDENYSNIG